jgi:hypothetical protein
MGWLRLGVAVVVSGSLGGHRGWGRGHGRLRWSGGDGGVGGGERCLAVLGCGWLGRPSGAQRWTVGREERERNMLECISDQR